MDTRAKVGSRRTTRMLGLATAAVLALTACASGGEQEPGSGDDAKHGGTLTLVASSAMSTWHPGAVSAAVSFQRLQAVYGLLIYVDEAGDVQPGIAESFTTDDGGSTWTLKLREGVTFTDGSPYDAEAVKYNWDAIGEAGLGGGVPAAFTSEVVDELTLVLTLEVPDPTLAYRVAESIPFIASPASLEAQGEDYNDPVGAGPFILESWDPATGEEYVRNDDYFIESQPYVDELRITIIADPAQRVQTVLQGGADSMNGYEFWYADAIGNPSVATYRIESGGFRNFVFNTTSPLFSDVRARQAVALAIDADELVQANLSDPSLSGSTNMFPPQSPYYDAAFDVPSGDLDAAQALIDEVLAEGLPNTVKLLVPAAPENLRTSELLQLAIQRLDGLEVELVQVPLSDWRGIALDNDDFDISFYPGVYDLNPVSTSLPNAFFTDARENFSNFSHPDMDAALTALREATSEAERADAVRAVQEVFVEQVPVVPFAVDYRTFLLNADLEGVRTVRPYIVLTDEIWIDN